MQRFREMKRKILSNYAGITHFMSEMARDRNVPTLDQIKMRREIFSTTHTLDLSWSSERFTEEINGIDWEKAFPTEEEIECMVNDYLER